MRILIVSQYFPPETGGPQNRLASITRGFVDAGHEVVVITQKPNYPQGIIWDEFRGGAFRESTFEKARVIHTTVWEDKSKRFLSRIAFFLSFVAMSIIASFRVRGRFDAVIASSPPLFVGLAGWVIARLKRARYVFDVRDLWPDVAIAMGELGNPRVQRLAKSLERFIYRKSNVVTAVTSRFCDDIQAIVPGTEVHRVTNGTVPEHFVVAESKTDLRADLDLPESFLVGYIGNLGLAQGLGHLIDAAEILARRDKGVHLVVVGAGSDAARIRSMAEHAAVDNLTFRGRVDQTTAARYMAACDVLLVPLADHPIYEKFIPSKLFDSMAAARPVLLSVNGESRAILDEAESGWYYPAEDAAALADTVLKARIHADELDTMGLRGRAFVSERFSREAQAARMVEIVEGLVGMKPEQALPPRADRNTPTTSTKQREVNKLAS